MLSALEHGRVEEIVKSAPTHFIYQTIPDHIARAAGLYIFAKSYPRYVLLDDGSVVQKGHFDDKEPGDEPSWLQAKFRYHLGKSYLFAWLASRIRPVNSEDLRLWLGIVKKSRQLVSKKFPAADFQVLLWDSPVPQSGGEALYEQMIQGLKDANIPVHLVSSILPDYDRDPATYQLLPPYDYHPNGKAEDILAHYVVREILDKPRH
jgi:hypothetical protein